MSDIRPYGPGKFNTILDSYVYSVSLDGGCDEEESESEGMGWYGIMRNGRTIFRDHDPNLETLTADEQEQLTSSAGVILREDSQGFVYVTYYDNAEALELAWSQIVDSFREDEAENPNHYSIQDAVSCYKCNPQRLTEKQYRAILDQGGDPSQEQEQVSQMSNNEAILWPWFEPSAPTFDTEKLTREPNSCYGCELPMVDIGETQIVYSCQNLECHCYRGGQYLDPLSGKGGHNPYLAVVQARVLMGRKGAA